MTRAQTCECVVNESFSPNIAKGGYYPTPIPDAIEGEYYDLDLTIAAPKEGELGDLVIQVNYIDIVSIDGLPEGIEWCKYTDQFSYQKHECIHIYGIPKKAQDYPLVINVRATVLGSIHVDRSDNSLTLRVVTSKKPHAAFEASTTLETINQPIQFYEKTDTSATAWSWVFEEGIPSVSTDPNPIVKWEQPGFYTVSLLAGNSYGKNELYKYNYIRITDDNSVLPVQATMTASQQKAVIMEEIQFFDYCNQDMEWVSQKDSVTTYHFLFCHDELPNISSCLWTFEGGIPSVSTDKNPTVYWNRQGVYDVALQVNGDDELLVHKFITINNVENDIKKFKMFPNPSYSKVTVEALDMKNIAVYSVTGTKLLDEITHTTHHEFYIDNLQSGVYFVIITRKDGKKAVKKLVRL
jgi:PKD repeat protein